MTSGAKKDPLKFYAQLTADGFGSETLTEAPVEADDTPNPESARSEPQQAVTPTPAVTQTAATPTQRKGRARKLSEIPAAPLLPRWADASYVPRPTYVRMPVELRDRLHRHKRDKAAAGMMVTDADAVEAGCRLLGTDVAEIAERYTLLVAAPKQRSVAAEPQLREELWAWLSHAVDALGELGVRASVNRLCVLALGAYLDASEESSTQATP